MRFDVITLFPEMFGAFLGASIVGRAVSSGILAVHTVNLRDFGTGKHRSVDDTPYGGGAGMVMRVDCIVQCLEALEAAQPGGVSSNPARSRLETDAQAAPETPRGHRVLLTPQGAPLDQSRVVALAARARVTLVCGRYEGFDERVRSYVDEELSLGDFVLTGGEIAAMAIVDACARLLPGVLGNEASSLEESHSPTTGGLLEYPQYTRPAEFRGESVPPVLTSGHHAEIASWRREQAELRTAARRPELLARVKARS